MLFVFFSAEEKGLLGSRHLAEKLKKQNFNLYTMLNFEMIGVPMKKSYTAYITGYKQSNMADKLNEYAGKNVVGFHGIELQYNLFRASDNFPFFLEFHVPSQTVCTFDFENYEYYHHPYDEFSRMDIPHMTSFIQEMIPAVEGMTNAKTKEIKLKK
jgi:Zn-dependent M28 family amino/carboxypeptidase